MLGLGLAFEKLSQNIPWNFLFSEAIRKRAIRYLLHRYVGQFLLENLSLDQLTVDLSSGTGIIKNLALDIHALNEVAEQLNLPFKFVDGYIGEIFVNIPWRNLLNENCFVGISGLRLVLLPKQMDSDISLVDSMIDSMTTSMQIAQECLSQVTEDDSQSEIYFDEVDNKENGIETNSIDAIEHFAKAIDTILNKIKVRFTDSLIRFEYEPKLSHTGIALEIKIDNIDYFDEAGIDKDTGFENPFIEFSSFTSKKLLIEGVSLYTHEHSTNDKEERYSSSEFLNFEKDLNPNYNLSQTLKEDYHNPIGVNNIEIENFKDNVIDDSVLSQKSILIAKLYNRQEIKIKLRKNEAVSGPKVQFEANCGVLILFLSPRQVHLLLDLADGMSFPDDNKHEGINKRSKRDYQKPMNQSDFRKVESDLIQHVSSPNLVTTHALNLQDGWSSSNIPCNDEFLPVTSGKDLFVKKSDPLSSSTLTDISELDKSYTSTTSTNICDKRFEDIITSFKIRLSGLSSIILHEDILISSMDSNEMVMSSSIDEMQKEANNFFSAFGNICNADNYYDEYIELQNKLQAACNLSHLRFIGTSLVVEGNEKLSSSKWEMKMNITGGWCELVECINEMPCGMIYNNILTFKEKSDISCNMASSMYIPMKPKVRVSIINSQSVQRRGKSSRMSNSKFETEINFDECSSEVDFSLIDRITTLLNRQNIIIKKEVKVPVDKLPSSHLDNQAFFKNIMEDITTKPETKISVSLKCSDMSLMIRFPIPDLRPMSDMNRIPWWKRNIRKEILHIKTEDFFFSSTFNFSCISTYEILCNDIHFLFQEKQDMVPISILRASHAKDVEKGFNPIRIFIKSFPCRTYNGLEDEPVVANENIMSKSMMGFLEEVDDDVADLFNKRKVASHQQNTINELTIPADSDEVNKFITDTLKNIQYDVDISLSDVQLILPSKHVYEVIYNRICSDLLLWVPSAPKKFSNYALDSSALGNIELGDNIVSDKYFNDTHSFRAFPPSRYESMENEDQDFSYQSLYDQTYNHGQKQNHMKENSSKQTLIGIQVKIYNGVGIIHTPYRDIYNKVIPNKHGNITFTLEKGFIFIASGYKGDIDSCQGSISLSKVKLYHKPEDMSSLSSIILNSEMNFSPKNLDAMLYPSDNLYRMGGGNAAILSKDSLTICFKVVFDSMKNEKILQLTGDMFGLTLRHIMTPSNENWMSQLGDFFNVEDYPIDGYSWPDVLTELNYHFQHCSIDYRPLHLPIKSYIAIESLAVLSNLTIKGNSSVLLFIIEDAGLFLSHNLACKKVNLKENYVCVADLGVFELCIKLENDSIDFPLKELLFSNNVIHIRTCSDSFKALMELFIYLANEGDLIDEAENLEDLCSQNPTKPLEYKITEENIDNSKRENTVNCHDIVENMMQEAMIECDLKDKSIVTSRIQEDSDVFLFPDEGAVKLKTQSFSPPRVRIDSCGSMESALREALEEDFPHNSPEELKHGTDDEFCILDDIPGTGIRSPSGKPKARHIKMEYVSIKESHFDPINISSFENRISTPKHFPKPLMKYNLQELSLIWHMYGGEDFKVGDSKTNNNSKQSVLKSKEKGVSPISSPDFESKFHNGSMVTFSNGDATIIPEKKSTSFKSNNCKKWFGIGGPNRCHDTLMEIHLSKIRFNYEIYPRECPFESHHLFTINDIEIRDRLISSKINKFLYQFCSESLPKQASANMVQIKAIAKRNDPSFNSSETNLNIAIRPIRLNVDQDALIFMSQFADYVIGHEKTSEYGEEEKAHYIVSQSPVMTVNYNTGEGTDILVEKENGGENDIQTESKVETLGAYTPVYFRNVVFSPDVPIRIDYHGKHIDMNSQYGALAGLIIGLGQLDHSEITLKRVELRSGVLGLEKLINSLVSEWIYDIRKNQLPSILGGVGPMHSFVKLFQGIKDFVWLPIEQYHKDGRVFRGLQRGTSAFTTSSAYAILDLTGRFVGCIQSTAEIMYDIVSSGPSVKNRCYKNKKGQPKDIREGVTTAYGLVKTGLGDTASALLKVASEEHSLKGISGAVGGVLRQIPPTVMQPIILASEATCTVIGGMTNQLVPDARKEAVEKWKV